MLSTPSFSRPGIGGGCGRAQARNAFNVLATSQSLSSTARGFGIAQRRIFITLSIVYSSFLRGVKLPPLSLHQIRKLSHEMRRTLVPARVVMQIQLMIILRVPPLPCLQNLCRNRTLLPPLPLHFLRHALRHLLLLWGVVKDGAAVLGAGIHTLTVLGSGIVHLVEEFEECAVREGGGIESHLEGFGMSSPPRANGPITRIARIATNIPHLCI